MNGTGKKITAYTDLYFNEYNREVKAGNLEFNDSEDDIAFTFFLFDKIVENFAAVGQIMTLSEEKGKSYLRNSVYILLRSSLYDSIILMWLFDSTDDIMKTRARKLRADHIKFHISLMKRMEQLGLLHPDEKEFDLRVINSHFRSLLPEEIKANLDISKFPKPTSITEMLDATNKHNDILVNAYKGYFLMSKIEHPGEFTRMILQTTYHDDNPMDDHLKNAIATVEFAIKLFAPNFFTREEFKNEIMVFRVV